LNAARRFPENTLNKSSARPFAKMNLPPRRKELKRKMPLRAAGYGRAARGRGRPSRFGIAANPGGMETDLRGLTASLVRAEGDASGTQLTNAAANGEASPKAER